MRTRVLVVEDDATIARLLRDNLTYEGFEVECAGDGQTAIDTAASFSPDLVLLDLALPALDGFDVCRALSDRHPRTAIVVVTARGRKEDKILGLEVGADDYITTPCAFEVVRARIRAVLRRTRPKLDRLVLGDVEVDFAARTCVKAGRDVPLTTRELELLHYLAERRGQPVTRAELLRVVWGYSGGTLTRTVDNCVVRLRRKIEPDPRTPIYIQTMYGDGYLLTNQS